MTPAQVDLNVPWQEIRGGGSASCGIAEHKAYCWGSNIFGQLGNGTTVTKQSPVAVAFP